MKKTAIAALAAATFAVSAHAASPTVFPATPSPIVADEPTWNPAEDRAVGWKYGA